MAPNLTPEWLELEKSLGGARPVLEGSPEEMRAQYEGLIALLSASAPPPDTSVARSEHDAGGVRVMVFKPADQGSAKLPVVVYIHGGGYMFGSPDEDAAVTEIIAKHTPAVVVSVDYRLSPAHKHPAALEDCVKAYNWAWENADSIGGEKGKFVVMGGSAGGGLALGVTNKLVATAETRDRVQGCVAIVPLSLHPDNIPDEYKSDYKAYTENATDVPVINASSMISFYDAVGADPKDADNFVGLASQNHKHFPPTHFTMCELDPLRDDGFIMEKMLSKAGVKTKIEYFKSLPHYFWIFASIPEGKKHFGNIVEGVHFCLSNK